MDFQDEENDSSEQSGIVLFSQYAALDGRPLNVDLARTPLEKAIYQDQGMWKSQKPVRFG